MLINALDKSLELPSRNANRGLVFRANELLVFYSSYLCSVEQCSIQVTSRGRLEYWIVRSEIGRLDYDYDYELGAVLLTQY